MAVRLRAQSSISRCPETVREALTTGGGRLLEVYLDRP
jgi:hypothetical protein